MYVEPISVIPGICESSSIASCDTPSNSVSAIPLLSIPPSQIIKSVAAYSFTYFSSSKLPVIDTVTFIIITLSARESTTTIDFFLFLLRFSHAIENGVTFRIFFSADRFEPVYSLYLTASMGDTFFTTLQGLMQLILMVSHAKSALSTNIEMLGVILQVTSSILPAIMGRATIDNRYPMIIPTGIAIRARI